MAIRSFLVGIPVSRRGESQGPACGRQAYRHHADVAKRDLAFEIHFPDRKRVPIDALEFVAVAADKS